jgi:PAS domain S-box-containing protein
MKGLQANPTQPQPRGVLNVSGLAGAFALLMGTAVLAGGWLGVTRIVQPIPSLPAMAPNTAAWFVLLGTSTLLLRRREISWARRWSAQALALLVTCHAGATLAEHLSGQDLGVAHILLTRQWHIDTALAPIRSAPGAAAGLLMLAGALLTLDFRPSTRIHLPEILVSGAALVASLAAAGYVYGATSLYASTNAPRTGMSPSTTVVILLLSAGVLCLRPERAPMSLLTSTGAGGLVVRRLLLGAFAIPVLGLLVMLGHRGSLYRQPFAEALVAVIGTAVALGLLLVTGRHLDRLDAARASAERALVEREERLRDLMEQANEAERVLRERDEMFRVLVEGVRDYAIFFLDPTGHVMTWNAGAERINGYRSDEIIGQSFVRFYPPQDVVTGVPSRLMRRATEEGVATDEGVRVRKDASRFWASVVLTSLHDMSGGLRGFATVMRDITEQKHAEQSMAILADASRLLAESLNSSQVLFTITHMVVPSFADGVLIHLRDPQGEPRLELFHAANPELLAAVHDLQVRGAYRVAAPSRRVMRTGRSELHPTLTPEWFREQEMDDELAFLVLKFGISSTIHVPIILAGRPFAAIVFAAAGTRVYNEHDLVFAEELARRASAAMHNAELFQTARQERERAEEAATLRERLVAIVGHDLRNPLASIATAAQLLNRSALATADEGLVSGIRRSASRMTRMIDQILDFARIRSGQSFELRLEAANLEQICQAVIDELSLSRPDHTIELSIKDSAEAICDSDRMAQALSNLIGNAIQYGTAGPITVTVHEATPDAVVIDVHNDGPAIPEAAQAAIFDAFNREASGGAAARALAWGSSLPTRSCARTEARSPCGRPIETGPRSL